MKATSTPKLFLLHILRWDSTAHDTRFSENHNVNSLFLKKTEKTNNAASFPRKQQQNNNNKEMHIVMLYFCNAFRVHLRLMSPCHCAARDPHLRNFSCGHLEHGEKARHKEAVLSHASQRGDTPTLNRCTMVAALPADTCFHTLEGRGHHSHQLLIAAQ